MPIYALELDIYSKNALLYNLDENKVLYEKNANEQISIASLTKIMTAIVALENIQSLDEKVVMLRQDFLGLEEANASVAGFQFGQIVTYRDLLYGLLLPSGADAAQALTRNVAGTKEKFVQMMNDKAEELNLIDTHFANETGLDEENHYSTLTDVATIFQYALRNSELKSILQTGTYTMSDGSFTVASTIEKNIKKYKLTMDYILGGKTGTTNQAGLCLASIAYENGTNYMLITARAPYPAKGPYHLYDAKTIYDYFIEHYENKVVVEQDNHLLTLNTKYAKEDKIEFYAEKEIQKYLSNDYQKEDIIFQYKGLHVITPKMKKGTKLGIIDIIYHDEVLATIDIILNQKVHFSLFKYIKTNIFIVVIVLLLLIILFFIKRILKNKIKKGWNLYKK